MKSREIVQRKLFPHEAGISQLWQQTSGGSTQTFSGESWHKDVKGQNDKECNQFKAGGDGHVEEKECTGNNALAVCGGEYVNL